MDVVFWVVLGIVGVAALVLLVVEAIIMRKPEDQRSDRERRFLRADRAVARGQQWYARNIAPWLAIAVALIGILAVLPLWFDGRIGLAAGLTAMFVVLALAMVALWVFVLRRRGAEWRRRQDEATAQADREGRPRWFVSGKSGVALGVGFLAFGGLMIAVAAMQHTSPWLAVIISAAGVLLLVLALVQSRAERRPRG
jgi:membrane protein implicated in regulation of membrane protease activity